MDKTTNKFSTELWSRAVGEAGVLRRVSVVLGGRLAQRCGRKAQGSGAAEPGTDVGCSLSDKPSPFHSAPSDEQESDVRFWGCRMGRPMTGMGALPSKYGSNPHGSFPISTRQKRSGRNPPQKSH